MDGRQQSRFGREILQQNNFTFKKSLGQNFLSDPHYPPRIAAAAGLDADTGVLEVGPGSGALTIELARRAGGVCAVEIDGRLLPVLAQTVGGLPNVTVVQGDILKQDIPVLCRGHLPFVRLAAAANLPYYITSPVIGRLLEAECFETITVMVQREVARRICAQPGGADYSALSVFVRLHAAAEIAFTVPSGAFTPRPKVDSAIVVMRRHAIPPVDCDRDRLLAIVRAAFGQRRKTLRNALASVYGTEQAQAALERAGIDPMRRGETLGLHEFAAIADAMENV